MSEKFGETMRLGIRNTDIPDRQEHYYERICRAEGQGL